VVLTDSAAGDPKAAVTCTVTNRFATGTLRIAKVVSDPLGGYIGGSAKPFSGTYTCGSADPVEFSTLTTATPWNWGSIFEMPCTGSAGAGVPMSGTIFITASF